MFCQGKETTLSYKMLVADYLAVPSGKVRLLNRARKKVREALDDHLFHA